MELFFNELSAKTAVNDVEAKKWITDFVKLCHIIDRILKSFNNQLKLRTTEDFLTFPLTNSDNIFEFLENNFGFTDPELIVFLGLLDSPYLAKNDPQIEEYQYSSIKINDILEEKTITGLGATFIKKTISLSFDSDAKWDKTEIRFEVNLMDKNADIKTLPANVKHASKTKHIIEAHLQFFADLFDFKSYKPKFSFQDKKQNLLPLLEIYSLFLGENEDVWEVFYSEIAYLNETDRIAKIKEIARKIAKIQHWEEAIGGVKTQNKNRELYFIPFTDFILSIDLQHGDFEVLKNQKSPNHFGSISFDGKRFKAPQNNHSITI